MMQFVLCFIVICVIPNVMENVLPRKLATVFGEGIASPMMRVVAK